MKKYNSRKKYLISIVTVIVMVCSCFAITNAYSNSANFNLRYTNSDSGNTMSQTRDITVSGQGYDVVVSELSGTSTSRYVSITCPYATSSSTTFTTTGSKIYNFKSTNNGIPNTKNYVTFTASLICSRNNGTAVAGGSISRR